jgi:hypothetical protein
MIPILPALLALVSATVGLAVQSVLSTQSERVYATILNDARCSGRGTPGSHGAVPVIQRELVRPSRAHWWTGALKDTIPRSSLLDALASVDDAALSEGAVRALGAIAITRADVDALAKKPDFWEAFFNAFSAASALVELSTVAFDASFSEALVYCGYATNPIGGEGFIVRLTRSETNWVAASWHRVWIA